MKNMSVTAICLSHALLAVGSMAFIQTIPSSQQGRVVPGLCERFQSADSDDFGEACLDPVQSGKFKILTCSSTSCSKMRKNLGVDEFATLGSLWDRKMAANAAEVQVEESSCLGSCKLAPCVAVVHEDFVGSVSLEGMTPSEFNARAFHRIITEDDVDRVWHSVESAIKIMAEEVDAEET